MQDKGCFQKWLHEMLKRKFMVDWDYNETFVVSPILFGDYLRMGVTGDDRVYEAVADPNRLSKLMENYLVPASFFQDNQNSLFVLFCHCCQMLILSYAPLSDADIYIVLSLARITCLLRLTSECIRRLLHLSCVCRKSTICLHPRP